MTIAVGFPVAASDILAIQANALIGITLAQNAASLAASADSNAADALTAAAAAVTAAAIAVADAADAVADATAALAQIALKAPLAAPTFSGVLTSGGEAVIAGPLTVSRAVTVSAAGTTQGTATLVASDIVVVTTCASGAGIRLRDKDAAIVNRGAADLLVYPPTGAQFETYGSNLPVTIQVGAAAVFVRASSTLFYVR